MAEQDSSPVAAPTESSPTVEDLLLQRTLDRRLPELQRASNSEAAQKWLRPSLRSERGTEQLLDQLERHVQQDFFLAQLQAADAKPSAPPLPGVSGVAVNKDWWTVTEADSSDAQVLGVLFQMTGSSDVRARMSFSYVCPSLTPSCHCVPVRSAHRIWRAMWWSR